MTTRQLSSTDDDVRRSIDVLDQVLSEFDDLDPFCGDGDCNGEITGAPGASGKPPPVDRSLKPQNNPPTIPQKAKKKSTSRDSERISCSLPSQTDPHIGNTQRSVESRLSEVSSHEYQEINSDLCSSHPRSKSDDHVKDLEVNLEKQQRGGTKNPGANGAGNYIGMIPQRGMDPGLRKSRSGEVSLAVKDPHLVRGRKYSRRNLHQRRGRSSDRHLDHFPPFDPRRLPDNGDPRVVDPNFLDPRVSDPRLYDPRLMDPRYLDSRLMTHPQRHDPRILDHLPDPRFLNHPIMDPLIFAEDPFLVPLAVPRGIHPLPEDPTLFPHLMVPPGGRIPGSTPLEFQPHTIPSYPSFPVDLPPFEGLPPHLNRLDPTLPPLPTVRAPHQHGWPMGDLPMPFSYPPNYLPPFCPPRERLSFDGEGGRGFPPSSMDPILAGGKGWTPLAPKETRNAIHRVVRTHPNCEEEGRDLEDRFANGHRVSKFAVGSGDHFHFRHPSSTGSSNSSGRSTSLEDIRGRQGDTHSRSFKGHRLPPQTQRPSAHNPGTFRLGEAVRREEQLQGPEKENEVWPRLVSGGKDSGFDESPGIDETPGKTSSTGGVTTQGVVGGGFVVAGIFSDSSKMYIPAPPSPTPDYDGEQGVSDSEDSDIPAEPFYVRSKNGAEPPGNATEKTPSSSNGGSLSEDSLQGNPSLPSKKDSRSSLQAMMAEFHMGLPPPNKEEGRFSDDSLEEEEEEESSLLSPSLPSTNAVLHSPKVESMESLISMDGSTTSFDYMSELHRRPNPALSSKSRKTSGESGSPKDDIPEPIFQKASSKEESVGERESFKGHLHEATCQKYGQKGSPKEWDIYDVQTRLKEEETGKNTTPAGPMKKDDEKISDAVPIFDTIKHLIREGLIEGLDETPPDFAPPPPPKMIRSSSLIEDRADSSIGYTASTHKRVEESSYTTSHSTIYPEVVLEACNSREVLQRRTSSPPPLPPPRDSSMNPRPCMSSETPTGPPPPLVRNQSWLFKNKKTDRQNQKPNPGHQFSLEEKSYHCQDTNRNWSENTTITTKHNNNLASQYARPQDHQGIELDNHTFHENMKNLHPHKKMSDSCSFISDDQGSVSSHGSRSGRFFSRFTESMKSGSRANTPLAGKPAKEAKSKKSAPKYHGDFIRVPSRVKDDAPHPPNFKNVIDPVLPLSRDGSGRFRSIEDLAELSGKSLEMRKTEEEQKKRGKKNSTLPPNLTPADVLQHEKDFKRSQSTPSGNKNKDEPDGPKFKFNIFKGLWRRNKYSFDKI